MSATLQKVKVTQDDAGHWYVIPNELDDQFWIDCHDDELCDSGGFDDKYGQYRTGGELNLVQLWAEV